MTRLKQKFCAIFAQILLVQRTVFAGKTGVTSSSALPLSTANLWPKV
jgi:hypothetical protein